MNGRPPESRQDSVYKWVFIESCANSQLTGIENEKLPTEVGWSRPTEPLAANDLFSTVNEIVNATAVAMNTTTQKVRRMLIDDIHTLAARGAM